MSNTKKPNWLQQFEQDAKEFNESKYSKYTSGQLKAMEGGKLSPNRYDSEYQSEMAKLGASKGGNTTWNNLVDQLGEEEARKVTKAKLHSNMTHEEMLANTKKAAKVSAERRSNKAKALAYRILSHLPKDEWFNTEVYAKACELEGKAKTYFSDVCRFHYPNVVQTSGRGPYAKKFISSEDFNNLK